MPAVVEHLEAVVGELESPPILIGHSAGGTFVQLLLDHGFGAAGVAINSAPTEGVRVDPALADQVARSPSSRTRPTATGPSASRTSSGTTRSRTPSARRSPGRCTSGTTSRRRGRSCGASCSPTSSPATRPPGSTTRTTTARRCCSSRAARTTSCRRASSGRTRSTTSRTRSPRSRSTRAGRTCCPPRTAGKRSPTTPSSGPWSTRARARRPRSARRACVNDVRITHVGGPTVLIEVGGWRLLTDPTFDPPGGRTASAGGRARRKLAGPAIAGGDLGPIDAVLLTHDHHGDNLDAGRARAAARRPASSSRRRPAPAARRRRARARALGRRRGSRRPAGRRSRSPPRRAATARR